jgi:ATP-dependent phosphofructokinase / diphosphate-dependent phosphofructokinase
MKIGILTGGGDCPGLNAVIQSVVKSASDCGCEVIGFLDGYSGLIEGKAKKLEMKDVKNIYNTGGTILGTSRASPFLVKDGVKKVRKNIKKFGISALIVIGGDGTLSVANSLSKLGIKVVCIPKTIDNDLSSTDYCIGFQTAVATAAEEISKLQTTAESHERVMVVELMGRNSGWLALVSGLAGGAHVILVPEKKQDIGSVCNIIEERYRRGKKYAIVAVAEGARPDGVSGLGSVSCAKDEFGREKMGGIAEFVEREIEKRTGKSTRSVVLGYVQRGGAPVAFDIVLGIRLGIAAMNLVKRKKFGLAVVIKGTRIVPVKITRVLKKTTVLKDDMLDLTDFFSMM